MPSRAAGTSTGRLAHSVTAADAAARAKNGNFSPHATRPGPAITSGDLGLSGPAPPGSLRPPADPVPPSPSGLSGPPGRGSLQPPASPVPPSPSGLLGPAARAGSTASSATSATGSATAIPLESSAAA